MIKSITQSITQDITKPVTLSPGVSTSFLAELQALGLTALFSPYQIGGIASNQELLNVNLSGTPSDIFSFNPDYPRQYNKGTGYISAESSLYPAIAPIYIPKISDLTGNGYDATQGTQANQAFLRNLPKTYGSIQSTGTLTIGKSYEIVTTETNHFFTGCAIGNVFYATAETALDANNTVKEVLSWKKPHIYFNGTQGYDFSKSAFNQNEGAWLMYTAMKWQTGTIFRLFSSQHSGGNTYEFRTDLNKIVWYLYNEAAALTQVTPAANNAADWTKIWFAYTWKYDTGSGNTTIKAYRDSVLQDTKVMTGKIAMPDQNLELFKWAAAYSTGRLYHFSLYNKELSLAESQSIGTRIAALWT